MVEIAQKTLLIRADANTRMGTGHVMRCIALGQAWQDAGGRVVFVSCCDSTPIKQRIVDEGFELIELAQAYPSAEDDLTRTIKVAGKNGAIWIVTDGYHFDLEYQQAIRRAGFKLICVDDYNHLPAYEADILLNQNIGSEKIEYHCNPDCRKLLGTRYVMLRREFRILKKKKRIIPKVAKTILVTLGGADPDNVTLKVIQALQKIDIPDLHAKIIVGPANPHFESLQQAVASSTFNGELITAVRDMPDVMSFADMAISAAGSTCWELCRMGVPIVTIVVAENQRGVASGLEENNIARHLGDMDQIETLRMAEAVNRLLHDPLERQRMGEAGQRFVDGFGSERILRQPAEDSAMNLFLNRLVLRRATMNDAEQLFEWVNDPLIRGNSFSNDPVKWEDHCRWLRKKLKSSKSVLMIAEMAGLACGQIRYDKTSETDSEIDISVSPLYRGMGMAVPIVEKSILEAAKILNVSKHIAVIHGSNMASARTFSKAGFLNQGSKKIKGVDCMIYTWEEN